MSQYGPESEESDQGSQTAARVIDQQGSSCGIDEKTVL
jgi:hypothetical protein